MQQGNQIRQVVICTHADGMEAQLKLTIEGFKDAALYLSAGQARAFANDLVQHAHRIEVERSLKQSRVQADRRLPVI